MNSSNEVLAVIPARGGSKGIPGKNIRPFAGLPLIAHSIKLAQSCPEISRLIVSTDSQEIADVARQYGADVPFMRPQELAQDDTPMWPVLRHALKAVEEQGGVVYSYLLLLDPTTPCRLPEEIAGAFKKLKDNLAAVGVIGVSKPDFNPIWHSVVDKGGWMTDLFQEGTQYSRRQDVPDVFRINGSLYIWRTDFVRSQEKEWRNRGHHLMHEVPDFSAISIDTQSEFERAELFIKSGLARLPWLDQKYAFH